MSDDSFGYHAAMLIPKEIRAKIHALQKIHPRPTLRQILECGWDETQLMAGYCWYWRDYNPVEKETYP